MKKIIFIILFIFIASLTASGVAMATPSDFGGGVNNEYEYEEMVFISGEPIKFSGEISISEKEKDNIKTIRYKFELTPEDTSIDGQLDRQMTYEIEYDRRDDKGQTIAGTTLTRYKEEITIDGVKYSLEDCQFSKSDIIDNRPASDYYSGTVKARKYYEINKDEGTATVDISGGSVGFENFWGSTETQILDYVINVDRDVIVEEGEDEEIVPVSWQGTVRAKVSDSMSKTLRYADNEATLSSFSGGHMRISEREMFSQYEYNLPRMVDGIADDDKRKKGSRELRQEMLPQIERLIIPKFRDTGGHWAEEYINKLYSLDVFDENSQFFVPDTAMTRLEFTRAVVKAADIRVFQEEARKSGRKSLEVEESLFEDIPVTDTNYQYVKEAVNKGIISGVSPELFMPDNALTRAQAITILIRALGFENNAPTPGYFTSFSDDYKIPSWARDSIYVAREIGLVTGDTANRVNPEQVMSRAEASAMLVRFLDFLQKDLQKDYREDIILYN